MIPARSYFLAGAVLCAGAWNAAACDDTAVGDPSDITNVADSVTLDITEDTGVNATAGADSGPDDSAADTVVADSGGPDAAVDTVAEDTTSADTALPPDSTVVEDTTTVDTADPDADGPFSVIGESAQIAGFTVDIYRPETPSPVPAVVFAPGFQLGATHFQSVGRRLASHGIFTLIPTFGDSLFAPIGHSDLADAITVMVTWLTDNDGVVATQIGAGGHSRGGKVSVLAAIRDPRIQASVLLDPVDSVGGPGATPSPENPSVTPELMAGFTIPVVFVGTGKGGASAFGQPCAPPAENYQAYADNAVSSDAQVVTLPTAGHNDFADTLPIGFDFLCTAGDDPAATRAFALATMTSFYRATLADDARYDSRITAP